MSRLFLAALQASELRSVIFSLMVIFQQSDCESQIPVGSYGGLPLNMLLNNVPHSKLARNFIYQGAAEAVVAAVQDSAVPRRMKVCVCVWVYMWVCMCVCACGICLSHGCVG